VKILEDNNIPHTIINYINNPMNIKDLKRLSQLLELRPKDFIRSKDPIYKELKIEHIINDDEKLFTLISKNPKLLERPIAIKNNRAIICRPAEKIIDLF
tara:strand:+ start:97 stop:393 length:297 start_codon:yes stop_codon:yes gene_type:complete